MEKIVIDFSRIDDQSEILLYPEFTTHNNYLLFLNDLSKDIMITSKMSIKNRVKDSRHLGKKIYLLQLTLEGLKAEFEVVNKNPEYALVCVSWISVKSYYVIFNLLLIVKFLFTGEEQAFFSGHKRIFDEFKGYIGRQDIVFSKDEFNQLYLCKDILEWKASVAANIRQRNFNPDERFRQILKKLTKYALDEFKRVEKIKNFRSRISKIRRSRFIANTQVNALEFFYWYRIKANYRDLEFLDKGVDEESFKNFYKNYYEFTFSFFNAFSSFIDKLSEIRLGKKLFEK